MTSRYPLLLARRLAATDTCVFCSFSRLGQRRSLKARRAPSTRKQQSLERPRVVTPELAQASKTNDDLQADVADYIASMTTADKVRLCNGDLDMALAIDSRFLFFMSRFARSAETDDDFQYCLKTSGLDLDTFYGLLQVFRRMASPADARFAHSLILYCDRAGYPEATIQVMASLLRQDMAKPGRLRTRHAMLAHGRLRQLSTGGNLRATVLEGKLAERSNKTELAISLYEQATEGFLEMHKRGELPPQLDELSSPWMELAILHLRRGDRKKSLEAYMMGISQDDPMAYYMLSVLDRQFTGGEYSSDWLWNVSKAAASGHFKACFDLGEYYADTKAPSPPSDCPEAEAKAPITWKRVHHFLTTSMIKPTVNLDPEANIDHYAVAMQDPVARVKFGYEWLCTARELTYVPAYLHLARLSLQKHIAPEGTLWAPLGTDVEHGISETKNPVYDPSFSHECLLTVFVAHTQITAARDKATTDSQFRALAGKWAKWPHVLEDYERHLDDLLDQAMQMADAVGMDIRHNEWGLLHEGSRAAKTS